MKKYLKNLIGQCAAFICLVGEDTQNSEWVKYELEVAKSLGKKILSVRIKGTRGGAPSLLRSWGIQETRWDSQALNNALSL